MPMTFSRPVALGPRRAAALAVALLLALTSGWATPQEASAAGGTLVGGVLQADAVWGIEGSPYRIQSTVQVPHGKTLAINPGVQVIDEAAGEAFRVQGTLYAVGTPDDMIQIMGNGTSFVSSNYDYQPSSLTLRYVDLQNGFPFLPATGNAGYMKVDVTDSRLVGSPSGYTYLWYPSAGSRLERNVISGIGRMTMGTRNDLTLRNNNFRTATTIEQWAAYGGPTRLWGNTFYRGVDLVLPEGHTSAALDARYNFWPRAWSNATIDSHIFDRNDSIDRANLIPYKPRHSRPAASTPDNAGPGRWDNCPSLSNPGQIDSDVDGIGDACDVTP